MKLLLALCATAVLAHAPPRIQLDLSALTHATHATGWAVHYHPTNGALESDAPHDHMYDGLTSPISSGTYPSTGTALPGRAATTRDWSARCPADPVTTTIQTCPFPVAKAYDHQDKDISNRIVTSVYLINKDGTDCVNGAAACNCDSVTDNHCMVSQVYFGSRAQYLFLYDVADSAGNQAEQVVYMLELDDTTPPTIRICDGSVGSVALAWEATNGETLCQDSEPSDNLDLAENMTMHYKIVQAHKESGAWVWGNPGAFNAAGDWVEHTECEDSGSDTLAWVNMAADESNGIASDHGAGPSHTTSTGEVGAYRLDGGVVDEQPGWFPYSSYVTGGPTGTTCLAKALRNGNTENSAVGVGDFVVYYRVCDNAGKYAQFAGSTTDGWHDNNCVMRAQVIQITDTVKPTIQILGANPRDKECYKQAIVDGTGTVNTNDPDGGVATVNYTDTNLNNPQAIVSDSLDTGALIVPGRTTPLTLDLTVSDLTDVDVTSTGSYSVHYNGADKLHANAEASDTAVTADQVTRTVRVVDTMDPTITLRDAPNDFQTSHHDAITDSSTETVVFVADDCESADHASTHNSTKNEHPYVCATAGGHIKNTQTYSYTVTSGWTRGATDVEPGWKCDDDCDETPTTSDVTWGSTDLQLDTTGVYTATYKCTDASLNEDIKTRDFHVLDNGKPIIRVTGQRTVTIEATLEYTYEDEGAVCTDTIDGTLAEIVGGDGVDLTDDGPLGRGSIATSHGLGNGHYVISFDCADLSGNDAVTQYRTVFVADTTCPVVTLKGSQEVNLEAGFMFEDPGATAQDFLGATQTVDYTGHIETEGNTVDVSQSLHYTSCNEIAKYHKNAPSGPYYIVRNTEKGLERVLVDCYIVPGADAHDESQGWTYKPLTGALATIPYQGTNGTCPVGDDNCQGDCPAFGLDMMEFNGDAFETHCSGVTSCNTLKSQTTSTTNYLCGIVDEASLNGRIVLINGTDTTGSTLDTLVDGRNHGGLAVNSVVTTEDPANAPDLHDWTGMAHKGVYVITYRVKDKVGNYNDACNSACDATGHPGLAADSTSTFGELKHTGSRTAACCGQLSTYYNGTASPACGNAGTVVKRTVTVQDTLPPIITLHLKQGGNWNRIQTSGSANLVDGVERNPARTVQNPWIHGASETHPDLGVAPSWMAQQGAAVNGWMAGALVSGIAGIALLAASFRKTPVTVEV